MKKKGLLAALAGVALAGYGVSKLIKSNKAEETEPEVDNENEAEEADENVEESND